MLFLFFIVSNKLNIKFYNYVAKAYEDKYLYSNNNLIGETICK